MERFVCRNDLCRDTLDFGFHELDNSETSCGMEKRQTHSREILQLWSDQRIRKHLGAGRHP